MVPVVLAVMFFWRPASTRPQHRRITVDEIASSGVSGEQVRIVGGLISFRDAFFPAMTSVPALTRPSSGGHPSQGPFIQLRFSGASPIALPADGQRAEPYGV